MLLYVNTDAPCAAWVPTMVLCDILKRSKRSMEQIRAWLVSVESTTGAFEFYPVAYADEFS